MDKKAIREAFRIAVFERDGYCCVMCGKTSKEVKLDAHHITDRHDMPNGGYVAENGISLCDCAQGCHWKAEHHHATGKAYPGYSPEDLYTKIGSDLEKAWEASEQLST
jgi:predicted restriction endonuclease